MCVCVCVWDPARELKCKDVKYDKQTADNTDLKFESLVSTKNNPAIFS